MMRLLLKGPRSLTRTMTSRPVRVLRTPTRVPKGSEGWGAVLSFMSYRSPLAVRRPLNLRPYQEAIPRSMGNPIEGTVEVLRLPEQAARRKRQRREEARAAVERTRACQETGLSRMGLGSP